MRCGTSTCLMTFARRSSKRESWPDCTTTSRASPASSSAATSRTLTSCTPSNLSSDSSSSRPQGNLPKKGKSREKLKFRASRAAFSAARTERGYRFVVRVVLGEWSRDEGSICPAGAGFGPARAMKREAASIAKVPKTSPRQAPKSKESPHFTDWSHAGLIFGRRFN